MKEESDHKSYAQTLPRPSHLRVVGRERLLKQDIKKTAEVTIKKQPQHIREEEGEAELIDPYAVYMKPKNDYVPDICNDDYDTNSQLEVSFSAHSSKLVFNDEPLPKAFNQPKRSESPIYAQVKSKETRRPIAAKRKATDSEVTHQDQKRPFP